MNPMDDNNISNKDNISSSSISSVPLHGTNQTKYAGAATNNSCSLTSSKKKQLKVMDEPSESLISSDRKLSRLPNTGDDSHNALGQNNSYEQRQRLNSSPYLNIEVVEGTLQTTRHSNGTPFVKWTIRVTFANNDVHYCYKRYSEFVSLRNKVKNGLQRVNESEDVTLPELPRTLPWYKALTLHDYLINNTLDSDFLVTRQQGLEYFLCYLMLDQNLCQLFDESIFRHWLNIRHKEIVVTAEVEAGKVRSD